MVTTVASSSQHRSHSIAVTTSQSQHRSHSIAISGHCKDNVAPVQLPPAPERQLTVRVMARVKVTATVTATLTPPHLSFVDLRFPRRGLRLGHASIIVVPQHSRGVTVAELQSPASHRRTIAVPRITTSRRCRKIARSARHQTASTT